MKIFNNKKLSLGLIAMFALVSCSSKTVHLDYASHPKLPMTTGVKVLRGISMTPLMKEKVIWGNYGGPGNRGGAPIDEMDELFRQHDIAYLEVTKFEDALASDRKLVQGLNGLNDTDLNDKARQFRRRAARFFTSPLSRVVGKPWSLFLGTRTAPLISDRIVVRSEK